MKGKKAIFKSLNIEANEITPVLLLIIQSVFLGIFYGTFDIGAHTLFLKTYPEEMIPKAYIISGLVGIVLTALFSKLQSKIKFSNLAVITLAFIALSTIIMRAFFEITMAKWTVFVLFLFLGPLNILGILAFWGTVGRIFNLRQGKRLFGIIDSGQVFGIIISSYAIPFILVYLNGTKNLLLISAISVVFALLIELIITKKIKIDSSSENNDGEVSEKKEGIKLQHFFKDKYILYMALFVIFSMFAAFFVQYSFLVVTNEQYPAEEDLAKYLAFFTGSMMAFTFLIKTFVYSKLMKTYGLKVSLILSSLLLGLFTGIAILIGTFSGYEIGSGGFIYFFLFISLSKLFNKTLKDALEVPAFKLLYQSLKKSIRFDVQAKIDGTINEIAALTSGILLSILGILAFIKLIHFSIFLFGLLVIWAIITVKLYMEYRKSLEKSLQSDETDTYAETNLLFTDLKNANFNTKNTLKKLNLLKQYLPQHFLSGFNTIIENTQQFDLNNFSPDNFIELYLLYLNNKVPNKWKSFLEKEINNHSTKSLSTIEISELFKSKNCQQIANALNYIYYLDKKLRLTLLWALLRVPDQVTQNYTIRICGHVNEPETINTLIEFLDSSTLFSCSIISLKQMAKTDAKQIIQSFYKTDISITSQIAILEVIKDAPLTDTREFLIENLSSHRKEIAEKAICILKEKDIDIEEESLPNFFHPITMAAKTLSWDISAIASIGTVDLTDPLHFALKAEFDKHQSVLMDLLSITYDKSSVAHVNDHLNSGTSEGIGFALELFDLFLSEEIKPMILAIFEDMPLIEKSRLLESYFPVTLSSKNELIVDIINRDPNLISTETKKVALLQYLKNFSEISNDLIAQLFNPIEELQISTAQIINKIDHTSYNILKKRLSPRNRYKIDESLKNKSINNSIIEILLNNKEIIETLNIQNHTLTEITDNLSIYEGNNGNFNNINEILNNYFVFLKSNHLELTENKEKKEIFFEGFIKNNDVILSKDDYIIGIKKEKMNLLSLTQGQFIQNLINTL